MKFDTPSTPSQEKLLDKKWYTHYKENGSFEAFDYLMGDKKYHLSQKNNL
jgi:hypothetical protein